MRPVNSVEPNPRLIRAEAALWVTRLHGPDRDADLEAGCRRWLDEDPEHRVAFELATDAWLMNDNLSRTSPTYLPPPRHNVPRRVAGTALVAAALTCCVVFTVMYFLGGNTLNTGPGEQKTLTLADGTEVTLNANTQVLVQYDDHVRRVVLVAGEALFNVTKHQSRPFDVVIGDRKVVALGTSFQVRREEPTGGAFAVTLIEGRVAIEPLALPDTMPTVPLPNIELLNPGERLRIAGDGEQKDAPSLPKVTAWQHGQLVFEDTSLREAAGEFNRYGRDRIAIVGDELGKIRVGGVYRIGDPSTFAQVIASAHHLHVAQRGHEIVLTEASPDAP